MREIKTTLENILFLVSCAEMYGFKNDVLFDAFGEMLGYTLLNEEIEKYAMSVWDMEGYSKEDYLDIKEQLVEFKNNYCHGT